MAFFVNLQHKTTQYLSGANHTLTTNTPGRSDTRPKAHHERLPNSSVLQFAEDVNMYAAGDTIEEVVDTLNGDFMKLSDYLKGKRMKLNSAPPQDHRCPDVCLCHR